jgi:hypothetical protein
MTETTRDAGPSHSPEERMHGTRLGTEKVPRCIVSSRSLGYLIVRTRLDRVDEIREPNGILDEKDWNVVSDNVWACQLRSARERSSSEQTYRSYLRRCSWRPSACVFFREQTRDLQPRCKTVDISRRIRAAPGPSYSREADKYWRLLASRVQKRSRSEIAPVTVTGKGAMSSSTPGMDRPFRDLWVAPRQRPGLCMSWMSQMSQTWVLYVLTRSWSKR